MLQVCLCIVSVGNAVDGAVGRGAANPNNAGKPRKTPPMPEDKGPNGNEAAQQKLDRDMVRWTRALASFTGALAIIAILQFWAMRGQLDERTATRESSDRSFADQVSLMQAQTKAMQGQLDQISLAQRPWVKLVNIEPTSLSSDNEVGVQLWTKIAVENVGHSPAQNVSVTADLLIDGFDPPPDQGMVDACRKGRTGSWVIPGRPVFPGQTQNIDGDTPSSFMIDGSKVWAARAARIKSTFDNRSTMKAASGRKRGQTQLLSFPFMLRSSSSGALIIVLRMTQPCIEPVSC
jgi:hypothetical protein